MQFYGLKVYDNGKLIHEFEPSINECETVGLYDLVSNNFFNLDGAENYKVNEENTECNCWRCTAERLFNARRVNKMKVGKVYLYQMYSESFEEFDTLEDAESFRDYADKNIPYWDYDIVSTIDLNNDEQIMRCKYRGWIEE